MSKQPNKDGQGQPVGVELTSEITLRLHAGPALATAELQQFDRLARMRGRTREELLLDLIREELAAALADAA